ncbi:MAG TPA: ATP-binding protein [Oligoflexus sp.]|uniref:sensor histidine kinase n=1 Tax=Oligoflexus sp. TaxID=1971216 RepID=UPI002D7EF823|nr:ATP-binding protein [Oligoflexus sp.]HET9236037.1 ATP-binding protein [Oligoflexus sp.]
MAERKALHLAWYQTTVVRAAALAILIILGGYVSGLNSIRQALHSLADMAYDEDLDQALGDYMDSLKELDTSKRQTLLLEMKAIIDEEPIGRFNEARIRDLLMKANINSLAPIDGIKIELLREKIEGPELAWLTRTELRVGRYMVSVPVSEVRQRFELVQQVKQKYELIEATWDKEIAPSLLLTNGLILIGAFSLVGLVLVWLVRRYVRNVQEVLRGFRRWSEEDPGFRLPGNLKGEMGMIAVQFNTMADEVELNRRKTLYLEKLASWQTMARKLAHEIKNPLTPIQMMVNQLQRKYKGEDEAFQTLLDEATKIIHEEVNALRRMVDHFSQFARLPDPTWEEADLLSLCQKLLELEKAAFPEHDLVLETKLASAPIMMDSQLMKQVIMNLIKNAAEASIGRKAHIAVQLEKTARHYIVNVVDDGPGIREEDLGRIFEAYYTTKHTGPSPGMGLGLAICKKIVMDHQGELTVTSQPGHTVFRIQLPSEHHHTEVLSS